MSLLTYLRTQESLHLWSLRWIIVGNFCVAGFLLDTALAAHGMTLPTWLLWVFAGGMIVVALLASIAKAVNPPGGHLQLPLGDAVMPAMPKLHPKVPPDENEGPRG
jgi:hypothetical protein